MALVKAGKYAEFEGRLYSCASLHKPRVRLHLPGWEDPPDGFTRQPDGRWTRLIERSLVSRLFFVHTEATWQGHPVRVDDVEGDTAHIWSQTYPPPNRPEVWNDRDSWTADVPVSELCDVVETVHEIPL